MSLTLYFVYWESLGTRLEQANHQLTRTNGDSALGLASLRCNPESVARTNGDSAIGGSPETWWTQPMAFTASSTADLDYVADKGAKWISPDKLQLPPDLPSLECI